MERCIKLFMTSSLLYKPINMNLVKMKSLYRGVQFHKGLVDLISGLKDFQIFTLNIVDQDSRIFENLPAV